MRFRQCITCTKKKKFFFLPSARIRLLPIPEKNSLYQEIKKLFSSYVFFSCFFVAFINFFSNRSKVFSYSVALINFSRNLSFFYFICFNIVFFSNIFFLPSLIRFLIFSDLKPRSKTQWLYLISYIIIASALRPSKYC